MQIEKDGRWTLPERAPTAISAAEVIEGARAAAARPIGEEREALMPAHPGGDTLITIDRHGASGQPALTRAGAGCGLPRAARAARRGRHRAGASRAGQRRLRRARRDGLRGRHGQGGDESAVRGARTAGDAVARFRLGRVARPRREAVLDRALALGLPLFVKPANLGSSVGISKVKTADRCRRQSRKRSPSIAR